MKKINVNEIKTEQQYLNFVWAVYDSQTYKNSYFVYSDCSYEGEQSDFALWGKNLTEKEAVKIVEENRFAVENCGTDYADIFVENIFDKPCLWERLTGEKHERAYQFQKLYTELWNRVKGKEC